MVALGWLAIANALVIKVDDQRINTVDLIIHAPRLNPSADAQVQILPRRSVREGALRAGMTFAGWTGRRFDVRGNVRRHEFHRAASRQTGDMVVTGAGYLVLGLFLAADAIGTQFPALCPNPTSGSPNG